MEETLNKVELRSEQVQDVLSAVPNWMIRWGNSIILIFILMLVFFSWFIKYPDIINAEAVITTELTPQKEYSAISGNIDTLLVENNEQVAQNQILAVIENTASYKDVLFLKSIIDTIKPSNQDFDFPQDKIPILSLGTIETDFVLFENSFLQYKLHKELRPFANEKLNNDIKKSELYNRLKVLESQKLMQKSELGFNKNDLDRHKQLFEKGVISKQDYEKKQLSYFQAERNYANMDASISQLKEALSSANLSAVSTEINQEKEDIQLLKNVIQSFNKLKRAIKDWELQYALISEINGKVSYMNIWNENQHVKQGDLVFTIIPKDNSSFLAKLKCPAQNSGKLKVGQKVNISLANYPETEFGIIEGSIGFISPLTDNEGYYVVDVLIPNNLITSYNKTIRFQHEMVGSAEIITDDLRLIERFFYQLRNIFDT